MDARCLLENVRDVFAIVSNAAIIIGVTVAILTLRRRSRADFRSEVRNIAERVARRVHDEVGSAKPPG